MAGWPDPLFDRFMPWYEVRDYHSVRVNAPPDEVMRMARSLRLDAGRVSRLIFALREVPARLTGKIEPLRTTGLEADARALGWGVLADVGRHLVMGAVTQPWKAEVVFHSVAPEEFSEFDQPGFARIGWAIRVTEDGPAACRLSMETRVATTDPESRRKFRRYWALLSPGIKAIRYDLLALTRREVEHRRTAA